MRFQGGICPEKIQLHKIQNDQLAAIIDIDINNIWKPCKIAGRYYETKRAVSVRDTVIYFYFAGINFCARTVTANSYSCEILFTTLLFRELWDWVFKGVTDAV